MQPVQNFSRSLLTAPEQVRPFVRLETIAASSALAPFRVKNARIATPATYTLGRPIKDRPVAEQLFGALADAKIWTSKVSMHLDRSTRDRLFLQLDVLHEADGWQQGDSPVNLDSYKSFVRAILYHKVNSRPSLSLMPNGNVLALWRDGDDKLTVEFLPGNRTRWFVQNQTGNGPERTTSNAPLERLRDVLQPYGAERWFDGG